uniref:Uncharacterized protein n=1 Tax=Knipowitschia caucasica TaxID=637954 RepID=A0AAV2KLG9_KNICA
MADKEMMERLRQKRTAAQAAFTKKANNLTSRVNPLEEGDVKAEWMNFKEDHNRVTDLGFEYSTALRELEDEEASVKANQIDERTHECDKKFDGVKLLVLNNLWTRFAKDKISDLVEEANLALDQAEAKDYQLLSRMERELINKDLEREVFEVNSLVTEWYSTAAKQSSLAPPPCPSHSVTPLLTGGKLHGGGSFRNGRNHGDHGRAATPDDGEDTTDDAVSRRSNTEPELSIISYSPAHYRHELTVSPAHRHLTSAV